GPPGPGAHRRAVGHGAPHRIRARIRRHAAAAGARGQAAGTVRPGRHAAHRGRPRAAGAAPAVACGSPGAGAPRPAELLGTHMAGSAQGNEGPLSQAPVAGRPVVGDGDAPGQAARHLNRRRPRRRAYTRRKRGASDTCPESARNTTMNNLLATLPSRAAQLKQLKWVETGAALAALQTGGRIATRFVRRNPAVAAAAVAGAGLLYLAARHHKKKREAEEAADTKTRRVRARRARKQPATQ